MICLMIEKGNDKIECVISKSIDKMLATTVLLPEAKIGNNLDISRDKKWNQAIKRHTNVREARKANKWPNLYGE